MDLLSLGEDILLKILLLCDVYTVLRISMVRVYSSLSISSRIIRPGQQTASTSHPSEATLAVFDLRSYFPYHIGTTSSRSRGARRSHGCGAYGPRQERCNWTGPIDARRCFTPLPHYFQYAHGAVSSSAPPLTWR
jgi:hypothetical protein